MDEPCNRIRVPKPSRRSYNPDRPLQNNTLLQNQVKHFREIEKDLPTSRHSGTDHEAIQTEGEAAEYIRRLTTQVHRPSGKKKTPARKSRPKKATMKGT